METVTISKKEYERLLDKEMFLEALVIAGVDNWQGYDDSNEIYAQLKAGEFD